MVKNFLESVLKTDWFSKNTTTQELTKNFIDDERGFTLLEMITTIVLIGIISVTIFAMYNFYFITAFESIESSNKQSTVMDIDGTIKSELLVYDADIEVDETGNILTIGDSTFTYDEVNHQMTITWPEDEIVYYDLYPLEVEEGVLPVFQIDNERIMFNIKLEDRHDTIEYSNQYIIRDGRYDKEYMINKEEEED